MPTHDQSGASHHLLLADVDVYLVHLVRTLFPDVRTEVASPGDLRPQVSAGVDLVVIDASSPRLGQALLYREQVRVVGVVDAMVASTTDSDADLHAVLLRPYRSADVHTTIGPLVGETRKRRRAARLVALAAARLHTLVGLPDPDGGGLQRLWEATKATEDVARSFAGRLSHGGLAAVVLDIAERELGATASVLLALDDTLLREVASRGLRPHADLLLEPSALTSLRVPYPADQHPAWRAAGLPRLEPTGRWMPVPVSSPVSGELTGLLLVAVTLDEHVPSPRRLRDVAARAGLAIESAGTFRRLRQLSYDEERQALARELRAGPAQAVTHLSLELELLVHRARQTDPSLAHDLQNLASVGRRTLSEMQALISEHVPGDAGPRHGTRPVDAASS